MSTLNTVAYRVDNIVSTASTPSLSSPSATVELATTAVDGSDAINRFEMGEKEIEGLVGELEKIERAIKANSGGGAASK